MNLADLIKTASNCAEREVKEEIGIDLSEEGIDLSKVNSAFFVGDQEEEVNQVHLGLSFQVELPLRSLKSLRTVVYLIQKKSRS